MSVALGLLRCLCTGIQLDSVQYYFPNPQFYLQVAATVAVACAALKQLADTKRINDNSQDFALPLLALGLRRESDGAQRLYCMPAHCNTFREIAGRQSLTVQSCRDH